MKTLKRVMAGCAAFAIAVTLSGCGTNYENTIKGNETADNLPAVTGEFNKSAEVEAGQGTAPKDLQSIIITKGDGKEVKADSSVKVKYLLQLWDGTKVPGNDMFEAGQPIEFSLQGVIPAWTKGLTGKHVGDRVLIVSPPEDAYGDMGAPPSIPPKATLVFVVDIVDVK